MRNYRSSTYRLAAKRRGIQCWLRKKALSEAIPENENVFRPRKQTAEFTVAIRHKSGQSARFSAYMTPWGKLSISPTMAGQKVKAMLANFK